MVPKGGVSLKSSIIKIILLSSFLWGVFYLFHNIDELSRLVHPFFHELVLYSFFVALVVGVFSHYLIRVGGSEYFAAVVLGGTVIRMILSIAIIALLLLRNPDNLLVLVVNFLIIYLSYLLFEIYSIITNLRQISKRDKEYGK